MTWEDAKNLARQTWRRTPFLKFRIREGQEIDFQFSVGYMVGTEPFICGRGDSWETAFINAGVIVSRENPTQK